MGEAGQKGPNRLADNQEFLAAIKGHVVGLIDEGALRVDDIDSVIEIATRDFHFEPFAQKVKLPGDKGRYYSQDSWFVAIKTSNGEIFTFVQYE